MSEKDEQDLGLLLLYMLHLQQKKKEHENLQIKRRQLPIKTLLRKG